MKLYEISLKKLKRLSKYKKIIFFGAGNRFKIFIEKYFFMFDVNCIECIVDNSEDKWGENVEIKGKKFVICGPEIIKELDTKKCIVLITPEKSDSIFAQIQIKYPDKKIICTTIPQIFYGIEKSIKGLMNVLPLKNIILLRGEGDTYENAKTLAEYIRRQPYYSKYKLVWLCNHPDNYIQKKEKNIQWNLLENDSNLIKRIEYYYYTCRAKIILFENSYIEKMRSEQISAYLKHGEMPIKCTKGIINLPSDLNFTIAASDYSAQVISEQYSINKERIFISGSPRTDIFFLDDENASIKDVLKSDGCEKNILWMPTFRKHMNGVRDDSGKYFYKGIPIIDSDDDIEEIIKSLKENNAKLVIKPHKYQDLSRIKFKDNKYIKVITQDDLENAGINTHILMRHMDAMITDYSSVAFDFMILNRPIAYSTDDLQEYKLDFICDNFMELMPGRKINNIDDMLAFIHSVANGDDEFKEEREEVSKKVNASVDGNSCKRVCQYLGIE